MKNKKIYFTRIKKKIQERKLKKRHQILKKIFKPKYN